MKKFIVRALSIFMLTASLLFAIPINSVYADPAAEVTTPPTVNGEAVTIEQDQETDPADNTEETPENKEESEKKKEEADEEPASTSGNSCEDQTGSLSWIVCPSSGVIAKVIDSLYEAIEGILVIDPASMQEESPVYIVWQYMRGLTNIVFAIVLIIAIYSQLTGLGIGNYGVKRILPRLIISVILVNLSFIICSLAVDISNVIGESLRSFFQGITDEVLAKSLSEGVNLDFSISDLLSIIVSGGAIGAFVVSATGGGGYLFFMLLVVLIGAIIAVVSGLITIAARQALVSLLVMIAPLAFVAYLLPNTEKWFGKWKTMLFQMLIFYPMFSFLFGASQTIGLTLILTAANNQNGFGIILGIAVEIFPLFFSWSLMKMSGTVLNTLNSGIRRAAAPIQRGLTGWGLSRAEQRRQNYIGNSPAPGAKLRRYLDYRQELRNLDTRNSMDIRKGKALERAFEKASSSRGYDEEGNLVWDPVANKYTINAKKAAYHQTRSTTADAAYKNTLNGYGRIFSGSLAAGRLSNAHAEAFKDAMQQQFLTVNEAQADQDWLLNQYLDAQATQSTNPYEYNRLVKSAAGGLGHTGESSIMGQVIVGNSTIENRRRTEARIIMTKFGVNKLQFRGMMFDKEHINDNGLETDENGNVLEDKNYRLLPGAKHTPWQQYIGVHKTTGIEITKEQYDALDPIERRQYKRVKSFDIKDDKDNVVQTVFDDDAGYIKEMLNDDIAIGDPINQRYLTELGVASASGERDGILRKYHSTIAAAMLSSRFKEHAAEVTAMLTTQANMGYIRTVGQYRIGAMQSFNVASRAGDFLQNDKWFIDNWRTILKAFNPNSSFYKADSEDYNPNILQELFSDRDIMNYKDVNGKHLEGMIKSFDENGNPKWKEVSESEMQGMSYDEKLQLRRNYVYHKIVPKTIAKLLSCANREITPNIAEKQKMDGTKELKKMVDDLTAIIDENGYTEIDGEKFWKHDFDDLADRNENYYEAPDPNDIRKPILEKQREWRDSQPKNNNNSSGSNSSSSSSNGGNSSNNQNTNESTSNNGQSTSGLMNGTTTSNGDGNATSSTNNNSNGGNSSSNSNNSRGNNNSTSANTTTNYNDNSIVDSLVRNMQQESYQQQINSTSNILDVVNSAFEFVENRNNRDYISYESLEKTILDYFEEVPKLKDYLERFRSVFEQYRPPKPGSTKDGINQIANPKEYEAPYIRNVHMAIVNLILAIG